MKTEPDSFSRAAGFDSKDQVDQFYRTLAQLEASATRSCLVKRGFDYAPSEPPAPLDFASAVMSGDVEVARAHGFGIFDNRQAAMSEPVESLSNELVDALGDCQDQGYADYRSQFPNLSQLPTIHAALNQRMAADPRIIALDKSWSVCMNKSGEVFRRPDDVVVSEMGDSQMKREDEVRIATYTARCLEPQISDRGEISADWASTAVEENPTVFAEARIELGVLLTVIADNSTA